MVCGPDVTNKKGDGFSVFGVIMVIGLIMCGCVWLFGGQWRTEYKNVEHIDRIVRERCNNKQQEIGMISTTDLWGNQLKAKYYKQDYKETYIIISAGDDQKMGTEDDQYTETFDINKSRYVGKFAGKTIKKSGAKIKEGLKGLKDGLFSKD